MSEPNFAFFAFIKLTDSATRRPRDSATPRSSCYDSFVDKNVKITEYKRTEEEDEQLGLLDMKTEDYNDEIGTNYGTNEVKELSDRLAEGKVRGADHPHLLHAPAGVNDVTVFGEGGVVMANPSIGKRGEMEMEMETEIDKSKEEVEFDEHFEKSSTFAGAKSGMIFKCGGQGTGYYRDYNGQ